jgi:hypothetical protein
MTHDRRIQKVDEYFEGFVIPRIAKSFPKAASHMAVRIEGSVGLGIDDEFSDLEASVYLDDELWKTVGWQLQILVNHCIRESCPWKPEGSVICVSRFSDLLAGQAIQLLQGEAKPRWERIPIVELFDAQEYLVLRDPNGLLEKLRNATAPEKIPDRLWKKWLLLAFKKLLWEDLGELTVSVKRGRMAESQILLGCVIEDLLRLGFIVNRRYYPWRKHLLWAFARLPAPAPDVLPQLDVIAHSLEWDRKLAAIEAAKEKYLAHVTEKGLLPEVDFRAPGLEEELVWAERLQAWSNPDWRDWITRCKQRAKEEGHDSRDFWVFSLWGRV